jgi:hypothetical protein
MRVTITNPDINKKGEKMKRIIMLTMVLVVMLVSLGGCFFWGYEGHDRDRDGRGGEHGDRGERHDGGGDHGERH